MLSLVDLKDFAEICRALEEHLSSGGRLKGAPGPRRRTRNRVRNRDDVPVVDSGRPERRYYRKDGELE